MFGFYYEKFIKVCEDSLFISHSEAVSRSFTEPEAFIHFSLPKSRSAHMRELKDAK